MSEWLLGKTVPYQSKYNPELLVAVSRQPARTSGGIDTPLPFKGIDIWNAWELSWLNEQGKPVVACARFQYAASSPNLVESKSFKLYLNSFNQSSFSSKQQVLDIVKNDLTTVVESDVEVFIYLPQDGWPELKQPEGLCLDDLEISISDYQPTFSYLLKAVNQPDVLVSEKLYSHLFKSNCMITGQPDWATIFISYQGPAIDHSLLLKYLISFRNHQAFHEPCVEQVFVDLLKYCKPETLSVYCRYTRRGGLDINPFRSTIDSIPANDRIWRQ